MAALEVPLGSQPPTPAKGGAAVETQCTKKFDVVTLPHSFPQPLLPSSAPRCGLARGRADVVGAGSRALASLLMLPSATCTGACLPYPLRTHHPETVSATSQPRRPPIPRPRRAEIVSQQAGRSARPFESSCPAHQQRNPSTSNLHLNEQMRTGLSTAITQGGAARMSKPHHLPVRVTHVRRVQGKKGASSMHPR